MMTVSQIYLEWDEVWWKPYDAFWKVGVSDGLAKIT